VQLSPGTERLFDASDTHGFYYLLWSRGSALLAQSTNAPAGVVPPAPRSDTLTHLRVREARREAYHFTEAGECLLTGRSIRTDLDVLNRYAGLLVLAGAAVLALGLGGGAWLSSRALRPLNEISAAAKRISAGNLSERILIDQTDDELGRLAAVLNSTFARLDAAFALQRQFVADASHEMRTPMTVLITEAQATLARARTAIEYRETIESCLDTAQQMRRLTESLLQLARLDAGQESFEQRPCDLAEAARACVERLRPLVADRHLRIDCELAPAPTWGDADRLGQVITNLLSNAIVYNRNDGSIRVRCGTEGGSVVLAVADTGIGIAPEHLPRIFDRFYRVDASRSGAAGRTGLGLAITKAIVEAHGGTIAASSQPGAGTEFIVRLPMAKPEGRDD
jgi:heavy metal sensor kinase